MRILILSCNTGQGHNTAAHSIKEVFEKNGSSCEIKNALQFLSQVADEVISDGHVFLYRRLPKLFGVGYRFQERHSARFMLSQLRRGIGKLEAYLNQNNFDAIICTHIFGAILVNELKKKTGLKIHTSLIITDFTCYPGSIECEADAYFIPHPKLIDEFVNNGIEREKIVPSGIPVNCRFLLKESKEAAREALCLPGDRKIILIAGGSMGCGPINKLALMLSKKLPDNLVLVACGTNKKLFENLTNFGRGNIIPLPYTKNMPLYLDAADVFLTKAGGLSTTEAILKEIPLIYINAVPGCETRNIDFMTQNSYAAAAFSPEDAVNRTIYALYHPENAKKCISNCRSFLPENPAQTIYDFVCDQVNKR